VHPVTKFAAYTFEEKRSVPFRRGGGGRDDGNLNLDASEKCMPLTRKETAFSNQMGGGGGGKNKKHVILCLSGTVRGHAYVLDQRKRMGGLP